MPETGGLKSDQAEIVAAIQQQVQAEIEKAAELRRQNELAAKSLAELERTRQGQQQRVKLAFDTNDKVTGLLAALERMFRDIRQINKNIAELERRHERTDDVLLLLLTEHSQPKIEAAREDLEAEIADRESSRRKLLRQHQRNLNKLREQAASYGLRVPVDLVNEIEAAEQAIVELKRQ